ncbi:MAG: DASS family sodium-coupled anion symporter [candidate division WOR-3 bacterium]
MSTDSRNSSRRQLIHLAAALLFGALAYLIPFPNMPEPARRCLGIVAVAAYLWVTEAIPLYSTAFLVVFLEVFLLSGLLKLDAGVFIAPFFDRVIMLFLGGFVLAEALGKFALDTMLAGFILERTGTRPRRVLLGMMFVAAFLSMWMSNTAATALLIGMALTVIRRLPDDEPFRTAIILGIPFAANVGGIATPIGSPPNAIAIGVLAEHGIRISFSKWMLIGLPVTALLFFFIWWLLLRLFPPRVAEVKLPPTSSEPLSGRQKAVVAVFVVTVLLWLTAELHRLPAAVVATLPALVLTGFGFLDTEDFGRIGWDILILMGGGLSLGVAIRSSGLADWLLSALHLGGASVALLAVVVMLVAMAVTTFISNTSAAAMLLPLVSGLTSAPAPLVLVAGIAVSVSMILPISTPPNAIAYGSGLVKVRTMATAGALVCAGAAGVIPAVVLAVSKLLGYL